MRITTLNSNFEYRLEDKNTLVNISDTAWKGVMISALKDGSDGISGMDCLVTGEKLMLTATEKLKKKYQGDDYMNTDDYKDSEIELEDKFIDFERCGCCHEGFPKAEMVQDVDPKDWICPTCNRVAETLDRVFTD